MEPTTSLPEDQTAFLSPEEAAASGAASPAATLGVAGAAGPGKPAPATPAVPATPPLPPPPPTELNFFNHHVRATLSGEAPERALAGMSLAQSSTSLPVKMPKQADAEADYKKLVEQQGGKYNQQETARFKQFYDSAARQYEQYQQGNYNSLALDSAFDNTASTLKLGLYTENRPNNSRLNLRKLGFGDLASGMTFSEPRSLNQIIQEAARSGQNVESQQYVQTKGWEQMAQEQYAKDGQLGVYDGQTKQGKRDEQGKLQTEKAAWPSMWSGGVFLDADDKGQVRPVQVKATDDVFSAPPLLSSWGYGANDSQWWRDPSRLVSGVVGGALKITGTLQNIIQQYNAYVYQFAPKPDPMRYGHTGLEQMLETLPGRTDDAGQPIKISEGLTLTDKLLGRGMSTADDMLAKRLLLLGTQVQRGRGVDERGSAFSSNAAFQASVIDVAAQVVPQIALSYLTGGAGVGIAYSTLDGYGATYKQFREQGYTKGEAHAAGVVAGLITGASEKLLNASWITRLVKGNASARELLEKPLLDMVQSATKEVEQELAAKGITEIGEQALTQGLAQRVPGMYGKFTNSLSALNARLGKLASKLGSDTRVPINWKDFFNGANNEGLQEVIEGVGQAGEQLVADKWVFNGKLYDWLGLAPADRLQTDADQWKRRQEQTTLGSFISEQLESYVLGAVGGGIGDAIPTFYAAAREKRHQQEHQELQLSLIQHYVENGGKGMDVLRERARQLGTLGQWGTSLTTKGVLPGDNEPSENDVITRNVLNQLELIERVAHDSNLFQRLKKGEISVNQAVGTLATYVDQNELYKRGLSDLLREQNAKTDRDNFYQQVLASPAGQPAGVAAAGQSGPAASILQMSPTQIQQERERRLAEASQIADADQQAKEVNRLNQRYQTTQDTGAVGLIARFEGVFDYYQAAKRVAETQLKLDQADAADVQGVLNLQAQLETFQGERDTAAGELSRQGSSNPELVQAKQLADKQLTYENLQQRARSVYDGTIVQHLTHESFLRQHYLDLLATWQDPARREKLGLEDRIFLEGRLHALSDPRQGFFDEKNQLTINGDGLRRLAFNRKFQRAQLLGHLEVRNQRQQAEQTALNQVPGELLAATPPLENDTEQHLAVVTTRALELSQQLGKGQLGFDAAQGQELVQSLRERSAARYKLLQQNLLQQPEHSFEAFLARRAAEGEPDADADFINEEEYQPYLQTLFGTIQDAAVGGADQAADALEARLQQLPDYQPAPLPSAEQLEILLGTSFDAGRVLGDSLTTSDLSQRIADHLLTAKTDPQKLASIDDDEFDSLRGSVMRNLALTEVNDKVNNLLYERQVAGKGADVDASVAGSLKTQQREVAETQAQQMAAMTGAPAPEPDSAATALGKAGEKATQRVDDQSVAPEPVAVKSRREQLTKLLDGVMQRTEASQSEEIDALRAKAIEGGWFQRASYASEVIAAEVEALVNERLQNWYDAATVEERPQWRAQKQRLIAEARQQLYARFQTQAQKQGVPGLAMVLGGVASWVYGNQLTAADDLWDVSRDVAPAVGLEIADALTQAKEWLAKFWAPVKKALRRQMRLEAMAVWHWTAPFGDTRGLHFQSQAVYQGIYQQSRAQLRQLDEIEKVRQAALADRALLDQKRRVTSLERHVSKLLNGIVTATAVLDADALGQQKLADAQLILIKLVRPVSLPQIGDYQVAVHQAEELLRQAFDTTEKQQALAAELLEQAQIDLLQLNPSLAIQPESLAVAGWQRMLKSGSPAVTEGIAHTLYALFGTSRAIVAQHYDNWLRETYPKLGAKTQEGPTPSLEQEDRVREAVQVLTAPWLFADSHLLSQQRAAAENSLFGIVENTVFLTGKAGAGKTQMAGAPIVAIMAGLAGQRAGGAKFEVTTTAQFETQRQDIAASVGRGAGQVQVNDTNLDQVLAALLDGSFAGSLLVVDEATILTRAQSQQLSDGLLRINGQRRQSGEPVVACLLLGDPAQLCGQVVDPSTKKASRMNQQHPIAETLVLPRLEPLQEVYRTGFVVLANVQDELRRRIESRDNDVRRDNTPIEGRYTLPVTGDYLSLAGVQYQTEAQQRQQIATHIKQLVAAGGQQKLMVVVSDNGGSGVATEVAALAALGVPNPEQYVVAVDKAQGKTYDFTYVAVNELTGDGRFSGNDNLRATLVGVSRSRIYASVRTLQEAQIKDRLEADLTRFADNEADDRKQERAIASADRAKQNQRLAALAPTAPAAGQNPATNAAITKTTNSQPETARPDGPPAPAGPEGQVQPAAAVEGSEADIPEEQGEQELSAAEANLNDAEQVLEQAQQVLATMLPADPAFAQTQQLITDTQVAMAELQQTVDGLRARQGEVSQQLHERREVLTQQAQTLVQALPSTAPEVITGTSQEGELDYQDVIARQGQLDETRQQQLRDARTYAAQLMALHAEFIAAGDTAGAAEIESYLADILRPAIAREQAQQLEVQQGMLRVGEEDNLLLQAENENQPVAQLGQQAQEVERAPGIVVGQQVIGDEVRVGTIIAVVPTYDINGQFIKMAPQVWEPPTGSTLQQLNAARAFINGQISRIRASRVQYENNRVAALAKESKVVVHAALAPRLGLLGQLFNKASFLRRLLKEATQTRDRSAGVSSSWFENYRLSDGYQLRGTGQFYLRYHESYEHGQDFPSNKAGEFSRNIFEVVYQETVGPVEVSVSLGMVRREAGTLPGRIRRAFDQQSPLDALFLKAQQTPYAPIRTVGGGSEQVQQVPLGTELPFQQVRPPAYFKNEADQDNDLQSVTQFRRRMAEQNVGVSQPFIITVASHDDFIQGNYSFYYGELNEYGQQDAGGRNRLSGRAVVFTAYGYSAEELSREIENLTKLGKGTGRTQGLSAHEIVEQLRTKYDAEMVLLNNRDLGLGDYAAAVLGERDGRVTTATDLLTRRATTYDPSHPSAAAGSGLALRESSGQQTDQKGHHSQPVKMGIETQRTFLSANQARFLNTPAALSGEDQTLNRGGIINKFFNLFNDGKLGLINNVQGQPITLTQKAIALLQDGTLSEEAHQELIDHLQRVLTQLRDKDVPRNPSLERNESGQLLNSIWNARYVPDLVLYLSYFDGKLNNAVTAGWEADEDNRIQVNPTFATGGYNNSYSAVFSPPSTDIFSQEPVLNMEELLETRRSVKSAPSYVLDLRGIAESALQAGSQQAAVSMNVPADVSADVTTDEPAAQTEQSVTTAASQPAAAAAAGPAVPPLVPANVMVQLPSGNLPAPPPRRAGRPVPGQGPKTSLNQDAAVDGDQDPTQARQLYETIFGVNPSPWLQSLLDTTPWLRKLLQPLGVAKFWQFDSRELPYSVAYGLVSNGLIQLNRGLNGLIKSGVARHEALHYALLLLPKAQRDQILSWARVAWEERGNAEAAFAPIDAVEEWLADYYPALFEGTDEQVLRRAERWKWLPGPILRFFFHVRDAFVKLEDGDAQGQLERFLRDLESGRYRGLRVSPETAAAQPARLALNQAGLRERAYSAAAAVFGGRRRLQEVADYLTAKIYDMRHPTQLYDGQLPEAVRNDAEAAKITANELLATWVFSQQQGEHGPQDIDFDHAAKLYGTAEDVARFTDETGFYHTPYERAVAHRVFVGVDFTNGVEETELRREMVFNAIIGRSLQHVKGKISVGYDAATEQMQVRAGSEEAESVSPDIYPEDADAPGETGNVEAGQDSVLDSDQQGEAGSGDAPESGTAADEQVGILQEASINLGKEHYLMDRDKLPQESAELRYHLSMTPYLRAVRRGSTLSYEVGDTPLPMQLATQVLREAAGVAERIKSEDPTADVVTYRHWAQALGELTSRERSVGARHDVVVSLLTRFFDHPQNARQASSQRYSPNPNPYAVPPSLYEQAFPQATGRLDLRGNSHLAEAGRIISQLYGFYNSLQRRNVVDVDLSGTTRLANEIADGLQELKNAAHSSMTLALFERDGNSQTWTPRGKLLGNLRDKGFSFRAAANGTIELVRNNPETGQAVALFSFEQPQPQSQRTKFGFARGAGVPAAYQGQTAFFADAVHDLLAELGFKGFVSRPKIRALVGVTDGSGQISGVNGFNQKSGGYLAQLLQPIVLEHVLAAEKAPRGAGKKALAALGIESEVQAWFASGYFSQQPQENLNLVTQQKGNVVDKHYSATLQYSETTQPLLNLLMSSHVQPERLNTYNATGNRVSLLQHANSLYHQLKQWATEQVRQKLQQGGGHPGWFYSPEDRYANAVRLGYFAHEATDVLNLGVLSDKLTGRKHQLTGGSHREFTRAFFEKFFLQELFTSKGQSLIIPASPKSDKETQLAHRLRRMPKAPGQLLLLDGSPAAVAALKNMHASHQALFRHNVLPRLFAVAERLGSPLQAATAGQPLEEQLAIVERWLTQQSAGQLGKEKLAKGLDYDVKDGQVTGLGKTLRARLLLSSEKFTRQMLDSLAFEAAELHAQGFTYFDKELADSMLSATGNEDFGGQLAAFQSESGGAYRVRIQDPATGHYQLNPLVTSFLLSQLVHRHALETAFAGSDTAYKPGSVAGGDGVDYAKRAILATTNYEAYDLNAYEGLPLTSRVGLLRTEKMSEIFGKTDYPGSIVRDEEGNPVLDEAGNPLRRERAQHLGGRYFYTDAQGQRHEHETISADRGQFFAMLHAMAPGESDEAREDWARTKIEGQDLYDGLQFSTMLHDLQHVRSGLQPRHDESQRKTLYGGLMPDGLPALDKTSTTRLTNELLENGNQQLWMQLYGMLGGFTQNADGSLTPSPLIQAWWQHRADVAEEYKDNPAGYRQHELRGNESWKRLAKQVYASRGTTQDLEQHHIGLTTPDLKVGNVGKADVMSTSYWQAVRTFDNRLGGTVLSLSQDLTRTDIANITQENYIFSLQGLNWQTTESINQNLGELASAGLLDMQQLVAELGGAEVFKRRAQEMLDNMGNVSNTNAMLAARLSANVPLLSTVMGTAIASQVKAKMSKLRFAGGRYTVASSSGRVNMFEVAGHERPFTAQQLLRDGYATRNLLGELVPTGTANFKVRELGFTRYRHQGGQLLSQDEAYYFASLLKAGSEGDADAQAEAEQLAKGYELLPMEVMVSRDAFKSFGLPKHVDFDQVDEQYFYERELNRLTSAAAATGEPTENFEARAREAGADLWSNFQQRAELKVTRIPVTGLNSIQVAKVVGFYDSQANTILMPAQVQTVAGADNDGDMVTVEYHDFDRQGRSFTPDTREGQRGQTRNYLRNTKLQALKNPLNALQLFHPIDFASLQEYKKQAARLEEQLAENDAKLGGVVPGYGPMGYLYRFAPSIATLIKNQQGKSGVGPFVKLSQLYYQNVALLKSLQAQNRLTGPQQRLLGDLQQPLHYGQYTINSTMEREVATANLLENVANGSLDNAKEDLLGWLNVNPQMWGAYSAMMFAQVPEAEIFRLLSHPYAKQIAQAAQRSRDVDQRYSRSVADIAEKILLGDSYGLDDEENLLGFGGFGYDDFGKATAEQRQVKLGQKLTERQQRQQAGVTQATQKLVELTRRLGAAEQAVAQKPENKAAQQELATSQRLLQQAQGRLPQLQAQLAATQDKAGDKQAFVDALASQELDEQQLKSRSLRQLIELDGADEIPNLEGVVNRYPKTGMADYMTRKFVLEQLYLFSLRGDELLQAQGVLRALEGPPGNELDALKTLKRVLGGLGYNGKLDDAIAAIKSELLADGSWPVQNAAGLPTFHEDGSLQLAPALSPEKRWEFARRSPGELVNMRAHVLGNPALAAAVRGLIFDYEQRRGQFITRQPVVQAQLERLMDGNRSYFAGKGGGTLLRELRAWLDSRFFQQNPSLSFDPTITSSGLPYLQDLSRCNLTTLTGQQQFLESAADYLTHLKSRVGEPGNPDIGAVPLLQELLPRDNEFGRVLTLNNSENLQPDEKAVLQSEFEELAARHGAEGKAVQQVLFTYALLTRGLNVGKGSLAEIISPEAAQDYSTFLEGQRRYFGAAANRETAIAELENFARDFLLLNPQAAPELRKVWGHNQERELIKRSYYYDRELNLLRDPAQREDKEAKNFLPLSVPDFLVRGGNRRYLNTPAEAMPQVLAIPNFNVVGGFAVYEKVEVPRERPENAGKLDAKGNPLPTSEMGYYYERRFSQASPQLNAYGVAEAMTKLPTVPIAASEKTRSVTELVADAGSEFNKSLARLKNALQLQEDSALQLDKGLPVQVSNGGTITLREAVQCKVVLSS